MKKFPNHALEKLGPVLNASFINVKYNGNNVTVDGMAAALMSTDPDKPKSRNMMFAYYDENYNIILDEKIKDAKIILYNIQQRDKIYIVNVAMLKEYLSYQAKTYPVETGMPHWFTNSKKRTYSLIVNPDILEKASYCEALPGDTMNIKNEFEKIYNYC